MKMKKVFLVVFLACLLAVTLGLGGTATIYGLIKGSEAREADADSIEVMAESIEQIKTYTQVELDTLLEEERHKSADLARGDVLTELKNGLLNGSSTVETLRTFYPNDLVLVSGGKYHFVPIKEELKKNSYLEENLVFDENGFANYYENGSLVSYKGIDVSKFQGKIDWNKVAEAGVDFAFIRVGYRGYGEEGRLVTDVTYEDNIKGANAAGVHAGVYFYTQAITEAELLEEVDLVLQEIAPYKIDCPVVFDVEKVSGKGRMNAISVEERTNFAVLFCEKIKEAGYKPMIYLNMEMGALLLDLSRLEEYDKWFAYYNPNFYYPYAYDVWQYSDSGVVSGIPEKVDLNISFKPLWE